MMIRFDTPLRAVILCATHEAARALMPEGAGWTEHWSRLDRDGAYRLLLDRRDRQETVAVVRRALGAEGWLAPPAGGEGDDRLLRLAADRLAGGWRVEVGRLAASGGWHSDAAEQAAAEETQSEAVEPEENPTGVPAKKERDHWITVELVGENGEPIPNEAVKVTDPGGGEHEGETDSQGQFTVTGIPEGDCTITFPELDQEAWEAATNG